MEPTVTPTASPVPVVPLAYAGPPDRPAARIGPVLGWATIAVAAVDAMGGLVNVL